VELSIPHQCGSELSVSRRVVPFVSLALTFTVFAVWAATRRGAWMDEYWTLWLVQQDMSLPDILRSRWLVDFNPPLFSFVHWLAEPMLTESIVLHRLLNLFPFAWVFIFLGLFARKYRASLPFLFVFATLLFAFPLSIQTFAELRGYFTQICVFYVLLGSLIAIHEDGNDITWRNGGTAYAVVLANVAIAFNLHYVSALLAGLIVATFLVLSYLNNQRRWAIALSGTAAAAVVPLVVFYLAQRQFLDQASSTFWISSSLWGATGQFRASTMQALGNSPMAFLVLLAAIAIWCGAAVRRWTSVAIPRVFHDDFAVGFALPSSRRRMLALLALASVVFIAAMLALHARQPIVIARYLVTFQVVVIAALALVVADALMRSRAMYWLFLAPALLTIGIQGFATQKQPRWDDSAAMVSRLLSQCPTSAVYAAEFPRKTFLRNETEVIRWAYRRHGRLFGFEVVDADVRSGRLAEIEAGTQAECPAVLWIENVNWSDIPRPAKLATTLDALGVDGSSFDLTQGSLGVTATGMVFKLPYRR
jgi:hypothetical protein